MKRAEIIERLKKHITTRKTTLEAVIGVEQLARNSFKESCAKNALAEITILEATFTQALTDSPDYSEGPTPPEGFRLVTDEERAENEEPSESMFIHKNKKTQSAIYKHE